MRVVAVSTPRDPAWRWRIVTYAGDLVEESRTTFATIGRAVAEGAARLKEMNVVDRSVPPRPYSHSPSSLRPR